MRIAILLLALAAPAHADPATFADGVVAGVCGTIGLGFILFVAICLLPTLYSYVRYYGR